MASMVLLLLGCGSVAIGQAEPLPGDAELQAFFRKYLETLLAEEPLTATRLGDHRFDAQLDDLSPQARQARIQRDRDTLAALDREIDPAKLSPQGKVDRQILRDSLVRSLWLAEQFDPFRDDPRVWVEYVSDSVYLLLVQSTRPREENLANAIKRIEQIPRVLENARAAIGKPPRIKTETAIRQAEGAADFYRNAIFALTGEPRQGNALAEHAARASAAIDAFVKFLRDEVLPRSDGDWRIGRARFEKKLELELDAGLTAADVLAEAEREAERVEREMAIVARYLWHRFFPGKAVPPDDPRGRHDLVAAVLAKIGEDHGTPESLVEDARKTVARIKEFITRRDILRLPETDRCRIVEMPEFRRGFSVAYLENAPPLDPAGSSEYAISPPPADWTEAQVASFLAEYNQAMLQILTIHEAYPGHYVQLEYSNRTPSLIRKVLGSGTFAEGWAVYTEQMMLDEGYGAGDLALRLQQLKFYLRAVVNAILDHHMHCRDMTDDQAKELLIGRAFQTEGEALGKITRAKLSSAQLSTYFVGRTAFYRLRQAVQRELGEEFDLGRYHEAVLSHGTVPVKFLPELTRERLAHPR
jgi:uncharacterized protein (DUF885 family)